MEGAITDQLGQGPGRVLIMESATLGTRTELQSGQMGILDYYRQEVLPTDCRATQGALTHTTPPGTRRCHFNSSRRWQDSGVSHLRGGEALLLSAAG